jgi:serine phosphatase RsbU (regulator of sigma subunit)/anti-sigma regulatory factor (Ser/Thr protein kinase)
MVGGLIGSWFLPGAPDGYLSDVFHWLVGDGLGVLTVGAPIVALALPATRRALRPPALVALTLVLAVAVSLVIFVWVEEPLLFLALPLFLVVAFRFGVGGVAACGAIGAFVANVATATDHGPFAAMSDMDPQAQLAATQLFLGVTVLSTWLFATEIHRRQVAGERLLAEQAARAEAEALQAQTESVALRLQHSLLPDRLVQTWEVTTAARYDAGVEDLEVGGDWYDTIALPDGRLGVAVGDIVGRGLEAAATMGRVRTALAGLAWGAADPGEAIDRLEAFTGSRIGRADCASCFYAVLDPGSGHLQYASAGHPPALLRRPDGTVDVLEDGRSALVGLGRPSRPHAETVLAPGSTLFAYSDGLIERRDEHLDVGLDRLVRFLRTTDASDLEALCDDLVTAMTGGRRRDDVAVIAVRYEGRATAPVHLDLPADPGELSGIRRTLGEAVAGRLDGPQLESFQLAVSEICANAVEHAYLGASGGRVEVFLTVEPRDVVAVVRDRGTWRPPVGGTRRGRGVHIAQSLADGFEQVTDERGTQVELRFRRTDA